MFRQRRTGVFACHVERAHFIAKRFIDGGHKRSVDNGDYRG